MTPPLPAGFAVRRPALADAEAIHALVAACDTRDLGRADTTLQDVADELVEPDFDRDRDGWLVHTPDGTLVGWGWACRKGSSDNVDIDVYASVHEIGGWLWDTAEHRAVEIAHELGHPRALIDIGAYRAARERAADAAARGYELATTFHRMRIDHDGPRPDPPPPPGATVHRGPLDEALRRQAHGVYQEAFAEHFGFAPSVYERWVAERDAAQSTDWSQLRLTTVDGEPAAMLLGSNAFVPDEGCGYVALVGTRPAFRGRGLARHLLDVAFAADAAAGRAGTYLHVDSNNRTPALGLYEGAGMRPVLVTDVWRTALPTKA